MKFTKKNLLLGAIAVMMIIIGMGMQPASAHALGRARPECKAEDGYLFRDVYGDIQCKLYKQPTVEKVKPKVTARPVRQTRREPTIRLSRSRVTRSTLKSRITKQVHKPIEYTRMSRRSIRRQIDHELENFDIENEKARIRAVQLANHIRKTGSAPRLNLQD